MKTNVYTLNLYTIEQAHRIYDTGSAPILVTCNDFRDWVCKHGNGNTSTLFNELIAAEFAKIWGIHVPDTAFITVKPDHVPPEKFGKISSFVHKKVCFGSLFLPDSKEVDLTVVELLKDKNLRYSLENRADFLKISLFDLWLANEDRNHNNFNLLLNTSTAKTYLFYAIDHENIFNTNSLKYGIFPLTEDDSILNTELAKVLFPRNREILIILKDLMEKFYFCVSECRNHLEAVFKKTPAAWNIDFDLMRKSLNETIFSTEWIKNCDREFRTFINILLLRR